jgi:hypothetical protein
MNARTVVAAAFVGGATLLAALALSPPQQHHALPVAQTQPPNVSWSPPHGERAELVEEPTADPAGPAPAPVPHAITMQDGTLVWAAQRMRDGNAPAREH